MSATQSPGEIGHAPRWQTMDRRGLIETARAWADQNMAIHDKRTDLAQSLRDAAFYRADALYEFAAHIEDGNFDAVRPADGGEAVHSPDEREGSRDEPKNTLAHPQKGGEG